MSQQDQLQPPTSLFPLTRHLSYRLTPLLLRVRLSPNQITTLSLLAGLLGGACFALTEQAWHVTGALALVLAYTLDNCDGEVARLTGSASAFGAKLDDVADWLTDSLFFVALGYGAWQISGEPLLFIFGGAASVGATIDYIIDLYKDRQTRDDAQAASERRDTQARSTRRPESRTDWFIYVFHKLSRADFCMIVLLLALLDITWVLLPFAAIGAQAYWIADLFSRVRGWHT